MKTIRAGTKRKAVVLTKRGKPVAKLVPVRTEKDDIFRLPQGQGDVLGDIVSPATTRKEWGDLCSPLRPRRRRRTKLCLSRRFLFPHESA